ncbi:hypothetical protein BDF19DRAFT_421665 [Syncephalis fuscata]|nr:hypothetical protein BDF19DRAFT_421665 [Syncephalis fuscata]
MNYFKTLIVAMVMAVAILTNFVVADVADDMLNALNALRAKYILPPLQKSDTLVAGAQKHSDEMKNSHVLGHFLNGEPGLMERYQGPEKLRRVAENISAETTLQQAMDKWEISGVHFGHMTSSSFRFFGGGLAVGADGAYYWTQAFA